MSNDYLIRVKIAPEDGPTHDYMGKIPKRYRGYEIKRILANYINTIGVVSPPVLTPPSTDKDVESSIPKKKEPKVGQREVSDF